MPNSPHALRVAITGDGPRGRETIYTTLLVEHRGEVTALAARRASILGLAPPYTVVPAPVTAAPIDQIPRTRARRAGR